MAEADAAVTAEDAAGAGNRSLTRSIVVTAPPFDGRKALP